MFIYKKERKQNQKTPNIPNYPTNQPKKNPNLKQKTQPTKKPHNSRLVICAANAIFHYKIILSVYQQLHTKLSTLQTPLQSKHFCVQVTNVGADVKIKHIISHQCNLKPNFFGGTDKLAGQWQEKQVLEPVLNKIVVVFEQNSYPLNCSVELGNLRLFLTILHQ